MDKIKIKDLEVFAHHGVLKEEIEKGQTFFVSVTVHTDFSRAAASDDLDATVDYAAMCAEITAFLQEHTFKLIETAADRLAEHLLKKHRHYIRTIEVEISKPQAPVGLPFKDISVYVLRRFHTAYISAGSNMGDREAYLSDAADAFMFFEDCILCKVSNFLETKPYGAVQNQPDFLNCCMEIKTLLSPEGLLNRLQELEREAGRVRDVPHGPRTLDLDLIFYDDIILDTKNLTVPHPDMHNRRFVLAPLEEIAPALRHPILGKTAGELLERLEK